MAIDGRVGRRALPLVMVLVGGCLGEPITVGRVGVDRVDDRDPPPGPHRNPTYTIALGPPFDPDELPECDFDADGHDSIACNGDDCDDRSADIGPDIIENEDWDIDLIAEGASLPSLALDAHGVANLVYRVTQPETSIVYATNESGSFLAETITSVGHITHRPSIAVGPNGRAHVCWSSYDKGQTLIGYATNSEGRWTSTVDVWHGGSPTSCAIAVDPRGLVHMVYRDPVLAILRYKTNTAGRWRVDVVDEHRGAGTFPVLMLDSSYIPHVGYQDEVNALRYAVFAPEDDEWRTDVVENGFSAGTVYMPSFTLDDQGAAHASYRAPGESELVYATNAPGVWVYEEISVRGRGGYAGVGSAIGVDRSGVPHVVYSRDEQQDQAEDLLFTTRAGGAWSQQVVDEEGRTGWGPTLVVGNNILHVSYFRFVQGGGEDVMYATRVIPDAVDSDCDGEW